MNDIALAVAGNARQLDVSTPTMNDMAATDTARQLDVSTPRCMTWHWLELTMLDSLMSVPPR